MRDGMIMLQYMCACVCVGGGDLECGFISYDIFVWVTFLDV